MSFFHPTKERRELMKFWVECVQALSIPLAIIGAATAYWWNVDTRTRELRKPFDEKQLALYAEASRIAARLAFTDNTNLNSDQTWIRFWELYWGELPFVESPELRTHMVTFCRSRVPPEFEYLCGTNDRKGTDKIVLDNAKQIARAASCEIRERWSAAKPADCQAAQPTATNSSAVRPK